MFRKKNDNALFTAERSKTVLNAGIGFDGFHLPDTFNGTLHLVSLFFYICPLFAKALKGTVILMKLIEIDKLTPEPSIYQENQTEQFKIIYSLQDLH